jgi:hypothetical protein
MPYKPYISKQPRTWWAQPMSRSEFMQKAHAEQPRMSSECDPSLILNLQRDDVSRAGRKPNLGRFLPDYSATEAA